MVCVCCRQFIYDERSSERCNVDSDDADFTNGYTVDNDFLTGAPAPETDDTNWPFVQVYELDGDVEITTDRDQLVTLDYDDHSDIATISVDRNDVPAGGQVHITISDFQLNLDPTEDDAWILNAGGTFGYNNILNDTDENEDTPETPITIAFDGNNGVLGTSGSDMNEIEYNGTAGVVTIDETGSNTGVFESQSNDISEISVKMGADDGDTFTIGYADDDQQVIVDSFDSTLELVADGTWNSGDTLTVRLTNENLNINTLTDDDMKITNSILPTMTFGAPITIDDLGLDTDNPLDSVSDSGSDAGTVTLTATTDATTFNVQLSDARLAMFQNPDMYHYVNYYPDPDNDLVTSITTDAQLLDELGNAATSPTTIKKDGLTRVQAQIGDEDNVVDGAFTITFNTNINEDNSTANANLNAALVAINADVGNTIATAMTTATATIKAANLAFTDETISGQNSTRATDINAALLTIRTAVTELTAVEGDASTTAGNVPVVKVNVTFSDTDADATTPNQFETPSDLLTKIKNALTGDILPFTTTFALEVFTFGTGPDGTVNDAIYRPLLEETSSDSGVFEGTIEYKMLNQISIDKAATYGDVVAVDDELVIILDDGYTGTSAPEVAYDGDHVREDAPTYTGEVSFDSATYRVADEVTVILVDPDLNVDAGAIDIYTVNVASTDATATLLHLEIGGCTAVDGFTAFSLRESADDSDTFEGSFEVPAACGTLDTTTGEDISATYYDFRDSSGGTTEWGDSATIGADTGSVSFDRTVYPVPADDSAVTVYVSVDDSDFDESSTSVESIDDATITVKVGSTTIATLGTADKPLEETGVDTGIFEYTLEVITTDDDYSLEQGSIITVTYNDPTDASGNENSVSDSATFDLRNAVLQSDKSTYVIGQDALLTLIEPDLNLDSDSQETLHLSIIAWDSDAEGDTDLSNGVFGAVPSNLRETDVNTGIFQVTITIPEKIDGNTLERGEEITLTYTDDGPSGADKVGETDREVDLQIETSDFGATIELDQNVYTWTDKVFITAVASDYNFDSNAIDEIGPEGDGEITIRVRGDGLKAYKLAETGPDTGVFTGEITLAGFTYDAIRYNAPTTSGDDGGPTDGTLNTNNEDGLSISFEYSDSEAPLVASALIRWNVGEVQWLEASYAATGSGIVRVIDPDMNTNPSAVDNIDDVVVYSETFLGGIELTVTETQEASGIFEGTVEFDPESASQGHRLQVTEGDIVTAEYDDRTLPPPDGEGDRLSISATTLIGSIVPPLERAPASNPAIVDAFNNALASVSVDQQVQITADLTSGQDRDQDFAYLVQIQNEDGVTIALSWITGTLGAGATFSPSQSWTPSETGSYTATMFVWESVSNPTALSPQLSITIDVV